MLAYTVLYDSSDTLDCWLTNWFTLTRYEIANKGLILDHWHNFSSMPSVALSVNDANLSRR